jgi:hypothetical protein
MPRRELRDLGQILADVMVIDVGVKAAAATL